MCDDSQVGGSALPTAAQAEVAVETLRMLADPTRLRILWALFGGEQSVGHLADLVGVAPSVVSQHLAKLRLGRAVTTRREGTRVYYAAADTHVRQLAEEALFHADHVAANLADHPPTRQERRARNPPTAGQERA
jgi:DNA-binding transcriptional ArsR family regulator